MSNDPQTTSGILLFAHGSPDPEWAKPFREILARVQLSAPERVATLSFLEGSPNLDDGVTVLVEAGVTQITLVPLFLARGGHLKRDLPLLLDAASVKHGVSFSQLPAIGESEDMLAAISAWVIG